MADVDLNKAKPVSEQRALEAEHAVLGSLLIDPEIAPQVFSAVRPDDFTNEYNRVLFVTARDLFRNGAPVDAVTLRNHIAGPVNMAYGGEGKGQTGGDLSGYLMQLMEITVTSANWEEYAKLMRDQSAVLRLRDLCFELLHVTSGGTLNDCRPVVAKINDALTQRENVKVKPFHELLIDFLNYQGECSENPQSRADYISYGFEALDAGMFTQPGDVVVIGGYPSDGKTAFALPLSHKIANSKRKDGENHKVGFFSLETNFEKLRDRLMTHLSQIDFARIKFHNLSERDWERLAQMTVDVSKRGTAGDHENPSLFFIEAAGMTASDIAAISRVYGFDVIFIDYVQIVKPETPWNALPYERVAAISRALHAFAQSTKTTVFELAQLSRPERGVRRDPKMSDLRESGQLEQDADAILFIFRPDEKEPLRKLRVAKNKEGVTGLWDLDFDANTQTFRMSAKAKNAKSPEQLQLEAVGDLSDLPF